MKIIKNTKQIDRYSKIGNYLSMAGLAAIVAVAFFWVQMLIQLFNYPEKAASQNQTFLFVLAIVAMILTAVSSSIGKRYGRSPRPDEKLDAALKGLPGETTLYHYMTPAAHVLVGAAGLWVLVPSTVTGKVYYSKKRWRISGGGFMTGYLRLFGQEGIGRPELDAESEIASLQRGLSKKMDKEEIPPISAVLVFTEDVDLDTGDSPLPAVKLKQLKDFFRQKTKEKALSDEQVKKIQSVLE